MTSDKAKAFLDDGNDGNELTSESTNKATIDMMLEVYKSVFDNTSVFYCSVPITSGKRYINWLERNRKCFVNIDNMDEDCRKSHFREVVQPNRTHAQRIIHELRKETGSIVVDPTALPSLPGWAQRDWYYLWGKVIERYVTTAFFINDWQYSNGCVYEFWIAQRKGIPTFDEDQCHLSLEAGVNMVIEAISEMEQRGKGTAFIKMILEMLKEPVESNIRPINSLLSLICK